MEKKHTSTLIRKFFENELPEDIRLKFHKWFVHEEPYAEKEKVMYEIWQECSAESNKVTSGELKKIRKRIDRFENNRKFSLPTYLTRIAAILLLPLLGFLTAQFLRQEPEAVIMEPELVEYFVPYGERRLIILPDNSEVWLNAGSLLIYEKTFSGNTRTLFLNGEANFHVAPDPEKPFIVKTIYMDVEALGTVFNVQSYIDEENSITTLETGKVKVNTRQKERQSVILSPNEQLIYNHVSHSYKTQTVDAGKNAQWKQGFLTFQNSSFNEIVRTIERRFGVHISYEAKKFKDRTFNVKFLPDENFNQILEILKDIGKFNYKIENNNIYITD